MILSMARKCSMFCRMKKAPQKASEDRMEKVAKWQPIATASASAELELSIYDKGEYHALAFPSRREGSGWRDVRANRFFLLEPSHWRYWDSKGV